MDTGAVTVMLYCFRERELLLNINEMLAGFRMFPSYMRIGGLREDLPPGFHAAVNEFLDRMPQKLKEYEDLLTDNKIFRQRTEGIGVLTGAEAVALGLLGPIARASGVAYDVRRAFPYLKYPELDFEVITRTNGDVFARYQARLAEMHESLKLCRQCMEKITPTGPWAVDDPRITPPPKDKVYTEMEALIQHFLLYSQGFTVPAGTASVPIEGPRGEQAFTVVSDGGNRPVRVKARAPSFFACQALPKLCAGALLADVIAIIGSTDIVL
jgi:NADH-quinone oxidoreductase subunit D